MGRTQFAHESVPFKKDFEEGFGEGFWRSKGALFPFPSSIGVEVLTRPRI